MVLKEPEGKKMNVLRIQMWHFFKNKCSDSIKIVFVSLANF